MIWNREPRLLPKKDSHLKISMPWLFLKGQPSRLGLDLLAYHVDGELPWTSGVKIHLQSPLILIVQPGEIWYA